MRITVEFPIGDNLLYACVEYNPDTILHEYEWPYITTRLTQSLIDALTGGH